MVSVFGLTGGIASGKSTVARLLRDRGFPVVDADQVARDVVAPGTPGLEQIRARFGDVVLTPDGHLDRARLGDLVFADASARRALEDITHPLIAAESMRQLMAAMGQDPPFVFYEAALLVETDRYRDFPALVVVTTPPEVQLSRVMERDGLSEENARKRMQAQMPLAEKRARADFVIENDGSLSDLDQQVDALLEWAHGFAEANA